MSCLRRRAMTGHGLHHGDYRRLHHLFDMKRGEVCCCALVRFPKAFTPMMRTRKGQPPGDNANGLTATRKLLPALPARPPSLPQSQYLKRRWRETRLPVCRSYALFLPLRERDAATYTLKYQYHHGQDLLVAPVHEQGRWKLDAVPAGRSRGEYLDRWQFTTAYRGCAR